MHSKRHLEALLGAASLLALAASPARAQESRETAQAEEQGGAALDAIVVTARRREESVIDVPVAVSAISAAALDSAHVTDVTQIAQMTPQLLIAAASGGGGGSISISGSLDFVKSMGRIGSTADAPALRSLHRETREVPKLAA